jgi:carboxylesterase
VPKLAGRDLRAKDVPKASLKPWGMPVRALASLVELMRTMRSRLPEVRQPTLLAHGLLDHTVPPSCLEALATELGTPPEQLTRLLLPRSFHILPLDVERELLLTALTEHLSRHLAPLPERA